MASCWVVPMTSGTFGTYSGSAGSVLLQTTRGSALRMVPSTGGSISPKTSLAKYAFARSVAVFDRRQLMRFVPVQPACAAMWAHRSSYEHTLVLGQGRQL